MYIHMSIENEIFQQCQVLLKVPFRHMVQYVYTYCGPSAVQAQLHIYFTFNSQRKWKIELAHVPQFGWALSRCKFNKKTLFGTIKTSLVCPRVGIYSFQINANVSVFYAQICCTCFNGVRWDETDLETRELYIFLLKNKGCV